MFGISQADQVQMIVIMFIIGVVAFLLLAVALGSRGDHEMTWEPGELGLPATYREPADMSYVDQLIKVRGVSHVLHRPDPYAALAELENPYKLTLAELQDTVRPIVIPVTALPGRHRALPELVAA